ncbi:MAG TPA: methyltransferase type 11, partial [Microbacterium sp.]
MNPDADRSEIAPRERYIHGHHESVLRSHSWRTVLNSAAYLLPHLA